MSGASRISRRCQVQRRVRLAHVRGSGAHAPRRASADARGTDAAERSTTDPTRRVAAHRRPATTAPRGDEPRRPPAGTTRSTPDPNRRVPTRIPATPNRTSRRRAAPAPTGTLRSPTRGVHPRGPHAHRRTGAPAREGGRTNSSPAPPPPRERCVTNSRAVSGAAPGSARCPRRFRGGTLSIAAPRKPAHRRGRAEHHRPTRRVPAHWRLAPTAPGGDEPRQPPAGATRSTTDPNHRVPTRRRPRPTAPRGGEPRQTRPAPRGTRHKGFTTADHTPRTAARALMHAMVAERTAHLHRHHTVSVASQTRWRCQVQRRVRLAHHRGSGPRAERRASAEPVPPVRACGAPPTRRTVSRPTGGHPPPPRAAMSRARHPRAPRGAPPTRTAVSPRAPGHAHPHLAATSRASPARPHAEHHTWGSPTRTTRTPPPHARSGTRGWPNIKLTCTAIIPSATRHKSAGGVRCSAGFGICAAPSYPPLTSAATTRPSGPK
ncbi:hypothetical protein GobsT_43780 [Gemmata obscuriglobus]|nr:hypothetical protein GobsT_43780 [Gemmata obscuriglobus]VTS08841.1 unnamed protein product [Gemmata obscuriglobus UQM 2246]